MRLPNPRSEAGQILVMTALMLPILVGGMALALDIGYAYDYRRQMQSAADASALAAAFELKNNGAATLTQLETVARSDATNNGFSHGSNGVTVTVTKSPAASVNCNEYSYTADTTAVRVQIIQAKSTFLAGIIGLSSFTINACAVANGSGTSSSNIIVLDSGNTNNAFVMSGGSVVSVDGDVNVNSTATGGLVTSGGSTLTASHIYDTAASCSNCAGATPTPVFNSPQINDPFASYPIPTASSSAPGTALNCNTGTCNIAAGTYDSLVVQGNSTVAHFAPGVYVINGNFEIKSGAHADGDGVTFYVTGGGKINFANNGTLVDFAAPHSGTNEGMLIFQDRADTQTATMAGGASVNLEGTVYIKNAKLNYSGGSGGDPNVAYTIFVVKLLEFSGGSIYINNDFSPLASGSPIKTGGVSLAE